MTASTQLRYLGSRDVVAALPDVEARLHLAERSLLALGGSADLPPKIGVQPRQPGSLAHAMPALLRGSADDGSDDLLGIKWVVGFPANVSAGIPAIHGTTILSDALTGVPRAILDAGALTAHRTAAVSGVAIARWGPTDLADPDRPVRVALVGAGAQARSHLPVIGTLLPRAEVVVCDRDAGRLEALVREVEAGSGALGSGALGSIRRLDTTLDAREAVAGADVVITIVSFGPSRQILAADDLAPGATIVAVDYDMCVPGALAATAPLFLVDDRDQYLANRRGTVFAGYPADAMTIGEAIASGRGRPAGQVLVTHLGVGLADVVFADAVLRRAEELGVGTLLER
jgi:ornithine cyclodeaminase/alanine dehydrogenase-like protein (mu-crystallin family)